MKRSLVIVAFALSVISSDAQSRHFFLTKEKVKGNAALQECKKTKGYHMASFWEIYNVSSLKYEPKLGDTAIDSGDGPPAGEPYFVGWVRTGSQGGNTAIANGTANCLLWTANDGKKRGTAVYLNDYWNGIDGQENPLNQTLPWKAFNNDKNSNDMWGPVCSTELKVWCVED